MLMTFVHDILSYWCRILRGVVRVFVYARQRYFVRGFRATGDEEEVPAEVTGDEYPCGLCICLPSNADSVLRIDDVEDARSKLRSAK